MKLLLTTFTLAVAAIATVQSLPAAPLDQAKLLEVSHAVDEFDARMLAELQAEKPGENVFMSAFSISSALSMLMTGGVSNTYSEIHDTLGYSKSSFSNADILTGYHQLMTGLNAHTAKSGANTVSVANAIALQKNRPVLDAYLSSVTSQFGAQLFTEDFVTKGPEATAELNHWVSEKTHGKIPKLFDQLPASTVMVLMNAIYFKGVWEHKFNVSDTKPEAFHGAHAEQAPFMVQRHRLAYAHFEDAELLELPYVNHTLSMYILLPAVGRSAASMTTLLAAQSLQQRIAHAYTADVTVHMPKFKFTGAYSLVESLQKLGIRTAFGGAADFSHINGAKDLSVTGVLHKSYIDVNEEGSEAAAATGIVVGTTSVHPVPKQITVRVDRPFLFFIRDNVQQVTLFSGAVHKPEYKKEN